MDEVNKVLDLMDRQGVCPVCKGSEFPMKDEQTPAVSDGAKLIAEEAMKDDPHPLFIGLPGSTDRRCLRTSDETGNRRPHDRHLDRPEHRIRKGEKSSTSARISQLQTL